VKSASVLTGESQTEAQLEVDKDRLIPGLAEGVIGQAQGETRDIRLTLPADYPKKDLAGSDVVFRITVKSIKERRLPPADELPQLMAPSEAGPGTPARQTLEE